MGNIRTFIFKINIKDKKVLNVDRVKGLVEELSALPDHQVLSIVPEHMYQAKRGGEEDNGDRMLFIDDSFFKRTFKRFKIRTIGEGWDDEKNAIFFKIYNKLILSTPKGGNIVEY